MKSGTALTTRYPEFLSCTMTVNDREAVLTRTFHILKMVILVSPWTQVEHNTSSAQGIGAT